MSIVFTQSNNWIKMKRWCNIYLVHKRNKSSTVSGWFLKLSLPSNNLKAGPQNAWKNFKTKEKK